MKVPAKARKTDHRTRDFPLVPAKPTVPLHAGQRRPPAPAKMPKPKK
jgi:hypothetical protein